MHLPLKAALLASSLVGSLCCISSTKITKEVGRQGQWLYLLPHDWVTISRFPHNSISKQTSFETEEKLRLVPGEKHPARASYEQFRNLLQADDQLYRWEGGGLSYPNQPGTTPTGLCLFRNNKIVAILVTSGWSVLECELK